MENDAVEKARKELWHKNRFRYGDELLTVVCLLPPEDARPLKAEWWRGKEVNLIAVEENGNFFLRHCDGTVRYWRHAEQEDEIVAKSVREFVSLFEASDRGF